MEDIEAGREDDEGIEEGIEVGIEGTNCFSRCESGTPPSDASAAYTHLP